MIKVIKISIVILFLLFSDLFSQWNFSLSTNQEYTDNPFHYPITSSTFVSSFNLGVEREINNFGLGYYGSYSNFTNIDDRNFYWHQIGFWNASEKFMFGLYAEQRINQPEYEYFDYSNYNFYLKYKSNLEGFIFLTQGGFTLTTYDQLTDLSNWMLSLGTNINKSFETKTTLIGGIIFNYKDYYDTNLDTNQTVGSGRYSYSETQTAFTSQINYYLRIAQSVTNSTGLALQYTGRKILDGTATTVRELEYAYGDESQYFDDPISYEGYGFNMQLTQILPLEILFRASYVYNYKEYPSHGVFIDAELIDDTQIRIDKQNIFNFSLSKNIYFSEESDNALYLGLSFQNINNSSNSYWYDYKANSFSLDIDFQF